MPLLNGGGDGLILGGGDGSMLGGGDGSILGSGDGASSREEEPSSEGGLAFRVRLLSALLSFGLLGGMLREFLRLAV